MTNTDKMPHTSFIAGKQGNFPVEGAPFPVKKAPNPVQGKPALPPRPTNPNERGTFNNK
jgi:hypothetical protein